MALFAVGQRFAARENHFGKQPDMLTRRIQSHLARRCQDGVAMQDDNAFVFGAREFFEAFAEFDFFAGEEVDVESAEFSERSGFAKDERAGHPAQHAAGEIPEGGDSVAAGVSGFEADGAAAGEAAAGGDLRGDVVKEGGARVRVGVDEDEPVAGGGFGAAIARAADLVDGFEDDAGSGGAGDFRGAIGGVVVAHDEFALPSAPGKGGHGIADLAKGFAEELFFIERRDDDGDAHSEKVSRVECRVSRGKKLQAH